MTTCVGVQMVIEQITPAAIFFELLSKVVFGQYFAPTLGGFTNTIFDLQEIHLLLIL